jgi:hypothetical protein
VIFVLLWALTKVTLPATPESCNLTSREAPPGWSKPTVCEASEKPSADTLESKELER